MTIVESEETPLELESAEGEPPADKPLGAFTRPQGGNGWKDWLFTVDHKKVGRKVIFVNGVIKDKDGKIYATATSTELVVEYPTKN